MSAEKLYSKPWNIYFRAWNTYPEVWDREYFPYSQTFSADKENFFCGHRKLFLPTEIMYDIETIAGNRYIPATGMQQASAMTLLSRALTYRHAIDNKKYQPKNRIYTSEVLHLYTFASNDLTVCANT